MANLRINQAHWVGDVPITAVAGMSHTFPKPPDILYLEFKAISGVAYYVLTLNPDVNQGTGEYVSGTKKFAAGATVNIGPYNIKKFTVTSHNVGGTALAVGEVGYMAFMSDKSHTSYVVVTT